MFSIFKLYPWEAMLQEEFGLHAIDTYLSTRWIEPIWKMLLSNKGILPILLAALPQPRVTAGSSLNDIQTPCATTSASRSPCPREGANITLVRDNATGRLSNSPGPYNGKQIVQALAPTAVFDNRHTVLGLWMIDQDCCGMGVVAKIFQPNH